MDKKYYLSEKSLKSFIRKEIKITKKEKISPALKATYYKGGISKFGTTLLYEGAILSEKNKKWLEDGKQLSRNFPQGQRVYSDKGIASSICGDAGGLDGKTGLYKIKMAQALQQDGQLRTGSSWDTNKPQSARNIRRLTPKECERLQGFPDDWTKGVSDTQRYKQMGNAVSVPVIMAIGRKLRQIIGGKNE